MKYEYTYEVRPGQIVTTLVSIPTPTLETLEEMIQRIHDCQDFPEFKIRVFNV